jgi:hypothetical protein
MMIPRTLRPTAVIPINVITQTGTFSGCTLDISRTGIKIQIGHDLEPSESVTICHGACKLPFRVVWTKPETSGFVAGLLSLNQPLDWGELLIGAETL